MTRSHAPFPRKPCVLLVASLFLLASFPACAEAETDNNNMASVLNLSLEELMQMTVVSVSKKAQSLAQTAAAVFVIKSDDIRRSGASNIPEALRLAPGVQVAAIGQNKWSVSIRGFNSRFANKLLVLVDGRAIYSPAFSGVFWEHQEIPLDNVERIEVIRGPGGAIWGANAVNGVINIITRTAADAQGGLLSAAVGDELRGSMLARYGWALDEDTHLRLHANAKSSDGGQIVGGGDGSDDWHSKQAGFRLDATRGGDSFSLQGAISDYQAGDTITAFTTTPPFASPLHTDGDGSTAHLLGRWERQTASGAHSLQAYLDQSDHDIGVFRYRINTFDLEYQQQIDSDKHDLVWGLGYRGSRDQTYDTPHVFMRDTRKSFSLFSAFIQDEITLTPDRWRLTLGSRFEHNDFTGVEVQPNVRLLWTPNQADSVWAAVSRAVRTPSRGETGAAAFIAPPQPPFVPLSLASVGDPNMDSEKLAALDLGWRRQWTPTLTSEVAAFYYRHADLRGVGFPGAPLPYGGSFYLPMQLTNAVDAESYGLEMSFDWLPLPNWRLQANTALFDIKTRNPKFVLSADGEFIGTTPSHQISLRSSLDITPSLQWDTWLRHVGKLSGSVSGVDNVPAYTSLDMRLAWKPARNLELSLVGQNLLDSSHPEIVVTNIVSMPIEIERGIYLKADWKF
jgi:iron complex outermembrane recepter protein